MAKNPLAGSWNNSGNLGCQFPELFGLPISACLAGNCLSVRLLNLTLRQLRVIVRQLAVRLGGFQGLGDRQ